MCSKQKLTEDEAEYKIYRDTLAYLNGTIKGRRQCAKYYCRSCKAWHTTTVRGPVLNK